MQKILFVANAAPYGSERALSALRLAAALFTQRQVDMHIFLLSDAISMALANQKVCGIPSLGEQLSQLIELGARIYICRTCMEARGLENAEWLDGVVVGTMPDLARLTLDADKVISF